MDLSFEHKLISHFLDKSRIKRNIFDLQSQKNRFRSDNNQDFNIFFSRLTESGNHIEIIFLNNNVKKKDFSDFLNKLTFPIIVFENKDKITPIILTHEKGDVFLLSIIKLNDNNIEEEYITGADKVIKRLCTIEDVKQNYGFNYDTDDVANNKDHDLDIYFITGFSVTPILSDPHIEKATISPLKRLFKLLKVERKEIGYIYFFAVLIGIVNLALPLCLQAIIYYMSSGNIFRSVLVLMFLVISATVLAGVLQVIQLTFVEVLQQRIFAKSAYEFSFRIPKMNMESISKKYAPELVNRFFDVINIQKSLPKFLIDLTSATLQIVFGLILLSFYHSMFIFFGVLLVFLIVFIIWQTGDVGLKSSIKESKYKYKVAHWLEELARNANTFKLAGVTNLPIEKTDHLLYNYLLHRQKHFKILKYQYASVIVFKTVITAGLLILGGVLVTERQINLGQFIAAEIIIVLIITSVEKFISTFEVIYDLLTALDKVGYITDIPIEPSSGIDINSLPQTSNFNLEIKNLTFQYPNTKYPIIKNLNFAFKSGDKICISGGDNTGKTTLIKILSGLMYEYSGYISFNGLTLRDISINSYRDFIGENISYDEIFEGTIAENITVGKRGITLEDLLWSIQKVGLSDFVNSQPNGLDTELIAGAKNLPSNIKQRIILARSIAEKSKLLVMDSDFLGNINSKKEFFKLLMDKNAPWAIVIATNDPMYLEVADNILFMKEDQTYKTGDFKTLLLDQDYKELIYGI